MQVGIHLPHIGRKAGPQAIRRAAIQAEELGFADAWSSEHIIIPKGAPYPPSAIFYDPVLTLTWAAAFTKKIGLGTSVLVLPMRHPLPLARSWRRCRTSPRDGSSSASGSDGSKPNSPRSACRSASAGAAWKRASQ
jgi:Luciferase-like monooxygenase